MSPQVRFLEARPPSKRRSTSHRWWMIGTAALPQHPPLAAAACRCCLCCQPNSTPVLCVQLQAFRSQPPHQLSSWTRTASRCRLCGSPGAGHSRLPLLRLVNAPCTPPPLLCTSFTLLLLGICIVCGCREEQYFDREEVLGRDAASVFPTESKKAAADGAGLAALLGANKKVGGALVGRSKTANGALPASTARLSLPAPAVDSHHTAGLCRCLSKQKPVCRCPHAGLAVHFGDGAAGDQEHHGPAA